MQKEILDYIKSERVGVLAVTMADGSPHGATMHYAFDESSSALIFLTSPKSKKSEAFQGGESKATFVIGTTEELMKSLQMDGVVKIVDSEELKNIFFTKFPEKLDKSPDGIIFTFTPTWWRFSDYKNPAGKLVLTSE